MKRIVIFFIIVFVISACSNQFNKNEYGLGIVTETEHAIYYAVNNDNQTIETIEFLSTYFEQHYERVASLFGYSAEQKTIVHVYTDKQQFQNVIGRNTEGTYDATDQIIKVYTPVNMTNAKQVQEYNFQLVHEYVHAAIQQINPVVGQIKWLDEGTAYYASLQLEAERTEHEAAVFSNPPTLEQLADPQYFSQYGSQAYYYCGLIVEYIVNTYGIDVFNDVLLNPLQIESILGISIEQLYSEWIEQL